MIQVGDICSARKKLGLSQEQLAEALGVSRNTVSRWERGEFSPSADKMAKLDRMLAWLEAPTVSADTPAPVPDAEPAAAPADPPPERPVGAVPPTARPKRWPVALVCAGVVCALLIGIAALIGVHSINRRLEPENIVPAEEIEGKEVDEAPIIVSGTTQPLQP